MCQSATHADKVLHKCGFKNFSNYLSHPKQKMILLFTMIRCSSAVGLISNWLPTKITITSIFTLKIKDLLLMCTGWLLHFFVICMTFFKQCKANFHIFFIFLYEDNKVFISYLTFFSFMSQVHHHVCIVYNFKSENV